MKRMVWDKHVPINQLGVDIPSHYASKTKVVTMSTVTHCYLFTSITEKGDVYLRRWNFSLEAKREKIISLAVARCITRSLSLFRSQVFVKKKHGVEKFSGNADVPMVPATQRCLSFKKFRSHSSFVQRWFEIIEACVRSYYYYYTFAQCLLLVTWHYCVNALIATATRILGLQIPSDGAPRPPLAREWCRVAPDKEGTTDKQCIGEGKL